MPVVPCRANIALDYKKLYQFLLASQQNCPQNCTKIVSISLEIETVDPLAVLNQIAAPDRLNFYFENKERGEAIAAIDAVAQFKLAGTNRFHLAQNFIQSCLENTSIFSPVNHPFSGPHFFCSFSFFNEIAQANYPFAAATVFSSPLATSTLSRSLCFRCKFKHSSRYKFISIFATIIV